MATDIPSGVQTTAGPAPPPGAVPVYTVPSPDEAGQRKIEFIKVYGHSNILYWWPVWAMCFLLAGWTYASGGQMAVLPAGSEEVAGVVVPGYDEPRDVLVLPPGKSAGVPADETRPRTLVNRLIPSQMTVARSNTPGVLFCMTLLLTAVVSSITLRGLVSVIAVIALLLLVLVLSLWNLWDEVFRFFGGLDVRMNAAGYLFVGVPLLVAWVLVVTLYDRNSYVLFDEGQIRYVREVGDSELTIPAEGAQVEKRRADIFRHWMVGFGSGDLVIHTGGRNGQTIELDNVLGVTRKLVVIDTMLRKKSISTG